MTFYDKFQSLCEQRNVSVHQAAIDMGFSVSTPSKWKNRQTAMPSFEIVEKIANYFQVPLIDFYEDVDEIPAHKASAIYERIEVLCAQRELSIYAFCKDSDIKPSTISGIKQRGGSMSTELLIKIARYFNISTDQLLGLQPLPAYCKPVFTRLSLSATEHNSLLTALLMRIQHLRAFANTQKEALSGFGIDPSADNFLQLALEEIGTLTALVDKLKSDPTAST